MEKRRKIVPPVYLILTLIAMTALHFFFPIMRFLSPPYTYAGIALLVLGPLMAAASARLFRKAGTGIVPFSDSTAVVTTGLFRYTRNPMYLGMVVGLLGAVILFGTIGTIIPIPLFILIIRFNFIRGEEKFMEQLHGEVYLNYKKRVRRWL